MVSGGFCAAQAQDKRHEFLRLYKGAPPLNKKTPPFLKSGVLRFAQEKKT